MDDTQVIAVDIGNSTINLALFVNGKISRYDGYPSVIDSIESVSRQVANWYTVPSSILIDSVVPSIGNRLQLYIKERHGLDSIMVEEFKTELLPLRVDFPESVGVDRIVNCYAAKHLFGSPAVVISLGTATTFDAISKQGEYVGGAIAPGIKISLEALTQRAALLPPVVIEKPNDLIAKNTLDHMKSGIYYGSLCMIEGMIRRFRVYLGERITVIGTGGLSFLFVDEGVFNHHEPNLNLKGLELIHRHRFHP